MSRQQRLEAEADVSTSYGSLDLHRLFNNGSTREGSASTTSFGAEEEAVALAAFNGDLRSVVDAKMAKKKRQPDDALENRQQPSNAVDPASLPPLVVIRDGGSRRISINRPPTDLSTTSAAASSSLDLPPSPRQFCLDFGRPASRDQASAAACQRSGGEERERLVNDGARVEEEGMETEEEVLVNGEVVEKDIDPEVDTATPEEKHQRMQARWWYRIISPDVEVSLLFKEFEKLSVCCNKQTLMRSSANQTELGSETLERKIQSNKRRREHDKEVRRMVQATKRKNAAPKPPGATATSSAATSVDASATPPAVFVLDAAAATSAAIHSTASGSRQSRPGLVHPPNQQQQGPRDVTPSQQSKRSRRGKTPQTRNVPSQQKGPDSKSKGPLQAPPGVPPAAVTPKGQGEASSGSSTATLAATQKLNQAPGAAAAKGKKTKRAGKKHKAATKGGSTCGASASAVKPQVSGQQTRASSFHSQPSKAAVGSELVGGALASVKAGVAPRQQTESAQGLQQVQNPPPPSDPAFDPAHGHHIAESLLREASSLTSNAPLGVVKNLSSRLPKDFFASLNPRQRVEAARQVLDERIRRNIQKERDDARQAAMAADNEVVKGNKRVVELEKQLEKEKQAYAMKAKKKEEAVERAKAAMAVDFKTASAVRPKFRLAPNCDAASPPPASSPAEKVGQQILSQKDAPKPGNKKNRTRAWKNQTAS